MKRIIIFITLIALLASMAIPAFAVTPKLDIKSIKIPEIKVTNFQLPQSFWDNYFRENPIIINWNK
jgi:hypothetical protein